MKNDRVVIEVSLNPKTFEQLKSLKNNPLLQEASEVHFLTILNSQLDDFLPVGFNGDREAFVGEKLQELRDALLAGALREKAMIEVVKDANPKIRALDFLKQLPADLVIACTRGEQGATGLFRDSFTFFLVENAPCDVYVIRPVH